jgi:cell division protein FtsI (penicillin-binding protein 3)
MGYQVGVTPLQMAAAVSSVANGGELIQPRVVRAVIRDSGRAPVPRKVLGRTISAATARQLTDIMEGVVTDGTGKAAQIAGYTVAGKTGTADKLINGHYSASQQNVSFVGFVPSRKPVFTIVVVVDSPHASGVPRYGGTVAAPIFQRIADAALRHQGIPPSVNAAPPVLIARRDEVFEQPTSGPLEPPSIVALSGTASGSEAIFPDLVGMSARDAVRVLAKLGMNPRLHGAGRVVDQQPAAGSPVDAIESATLWLER